MSAMYLTSPTYAYVYKWTELSTGRWYIGSRTKHGCNPADGYICSSRIVKPLIESNQTNWIRTVLCIGHGVDMLALETALLTLADAKNDPLSYNQHNGDGKFTGLNRPCIFKGKKLGPQSDEAKMKRSIAHKGRVKSEEHKRRISESKKGTAPWNKGTTGLQVAHNKGTRMSEEQKQKIRDTKKLNPRPAWNKGIASTPEAEAKRLASRAKNRQNKSAI
jgi:hypothetical protein